MNTRPRTHTLPSGTRAQPAAQRRNRTPFFPRPCFGNPTRCARRACRASSGCRRICNCCAGCRPRGRNLFPGPCWRGASVGAGDCPERPGADGRRGDSARGFPGGRVDQDHRKVFGLGQPDPGGAGRAGNLGAALLGYEGFQNYGIRIIAAFDSRPTVAGTWLHGRKVQPLGRLSSFVRRGKSGSAC